MIIEPGRLLESRDKGIITGGDPALPVTDDYLEYHRIVARQQIGTAVADR